MMESLVKVKKMGRESSIMLKIKENIANNIVQEIESIEQL